MLLIIFMGNESFYVQEMPYEYDYESTKCFVPYTLPHLTNARSRQTWILHLWDLVSVLIKLNFRINISFPAQFQDEPLPHELRPLPVLTMTMNYLLTEIANRWEEERWGEWYDFLWNRTRSIRKVRHDAKRLLLLVSVADVCTSFVSSWIASRLCSAWNFTSQWYRDHPVDSSTLLLSVPAVGRG